MAEHDSEAGPIAVYGSTGYTGRLVARELRRRGLTITLSGRNQRKLDELAGDLGGDAAVRPARIDDPGSLRDLFDGCAAVINCAGPFSSIGEPVVAAAIAAGCHYVDTTGEQLFMKRIFDDHATAARRASVTVVPGMGFDYAPGDMLSHLAGQGLTPLDDLTLAYFVKMRGSHGTMLSVLEMMRSGSVTYENGDWRAAPRRFSTRLFDFPQPIGPQPMIDYPSGEILTVPRHTPTEQVTSLVSAATFAPRVLAPALPAVEIAASLATRTPLMGLMGWLVQRLPEGPTEQQRAEASFTIALRATAGRRKRRAVLRGTDIYGLTALLVADGAARLAGAGYDRTGVLAPSEAFDAKTSLDALAAAGVSYELEPIGGS